MIGKQKHIMQILKVRTNKGLQIFIVSFLFVVFVPIYILLVSDKISVCECNYAAKRHVWYNDDGNGKWQKCCESYRYEIENYGHEKIGEFDVDIYDFGIGYFADECTPKRF
jgi:hypothetical protein